MTTVHFRGIRPDDLHGRMGLANPERGFRTEMYASEIPGEIAGMCSVHQKALKLDGRPLAPRYVNRLIRGNRLDGVEFRHAQWQDELDFLAYDGVRVMQSYVYLIRFSDGRDLTDAKLADIEEFLAQVRRAGVKSLLRFAYELRPRTIGPDAATILRHLETLRPLLRRNSDVIHALQCGFVGVFGEWHNSYHHLEQDTAFHRELFTAVLDALPADRRSMIRYPRIKRGVYGDAPLDAALAHTGDPRARLGHFNDGFLAGPSHGGTFVNPDPEAEMAYVAAESAYVPVDGELFWMDLQGVAEPLEAVRLFAAHHYDTFGFVHSHSLFERDDAYSMDLWKRIPADPGALRDAGHPLSDQYFFDRRGDPVLRSYYEYIRDHLGYRLELASATLPETVKRGGRVTGEIVLVNRGFSAPVNPRPVELALRGGETMWRLTLDADIRRWYAGEKIRLAVDAVAPDDVPPGEYAAGLALPDAAPALRDRPDYAIRCANDLRYDGGVNWLGLALSIA